MILGSHNSMSYLPPYHWWLLPFRFMARCQSATIMEQYEKYGVRLFDLRIMYNDNGIAHFCHGVMRFKGDVDIVMQELSDKGDVMVRLILEETRNSNSKRNEKYFIKDCEYWKTHCPGIMFYGCNRKRDWKQLFDFGNGEIESKIKHRYASMQGGKIDDLFPKRYARKNNSSNRQKYADENEILMIDYVNI